MKEEKLEEESKFEKFFFNNKENNTTESILNAFQMFFVALSVVVLASFIFPNHNINFWINLVILGMTGFLLRVNRKIKAKKEEKENGVFSKE